MFLGVNGLQGDGDIYKPDNLQEFQKFVLENTDGVGVHFVMADGVCSFNCYSLFNKVKCMQLKY